MANNNYLPLEFLHFAADKQQESKFSAAQIGVWNVELPNRVHAACLQIKGQPLYGWFIAASNNRTQARF
jgi:hypothetical protein